MRLLSLEVEHFRGVAAAALTFGPGLTVVHGSNDLGKSTIAEAIRAAFLILPSVSEADTYVAWGGSDPPRVVATFEVQGASWRVDKTFGAGRRGKAYLLKASNSDRYHREAEGRDVEGRLRALLSWGIPAPGGRGAPSRSESFLVTALLGRQGEVRSILDASLKRDQDESGRSIVTQALGALGQDPLVARLIERLDEQLGEAFTESGRHKRTADSPLVKTQSDLKAREARLRELEDAEQEATIVRGQVTHLIARRNEILERRDEIARQFEVARQSQQAAAESRLTRATTKNMAAAHELDAAHQSARTAAERSAKAKTAKDQAVQLAQSERDRQMADLQRRRDAAAARLKGAEDAQRVDLEAQALEEQLANAHLEAKRASEALVAAGQNQERAALLEELKAVEAAHADASHATAQYAAAQAEEASANRSVETTKAQLEAAFRDRDAASQQLDQFRRVGAEHSRLTAAGQVAETRALAAVDDAKRTLDRLIDAAKWLERSESSKRSTANALSEVESLEREHADNAEALRLAESDLADWRAVVVRLRRRMLSDRIAALEDAAERARTGKQNAATKRSRAARLEQQAAQSTIAVPASAAVSPVVLVASAAAGLVAGILALFALSLSLPIAMAAGIAITALIVTLGALAGRGRDAGHQKQESDVAGERLRRDAEDLRQQAVADDDTAAEAAAEAAGIAAARQELESFGHQDDGEGRLSVVDRMREAGEDLRVASRRLNDEELRAKALQDERGQLQQKRTLASARAEQLSLGANRDRSEFESSLELAGGACSPDVVVAARARVAAAEGELQRIRADRRDLPEDAVDLHVAEQRLSAAADAVARAQTELEACLAERNTIAAAVVTKRALLDVATKAYTGISIEQVRARLDACIGDGPEQFDLSREAAASEYKRCQQDAADRIASVRTLEQSASAARREVERLRATGILAARAEAERDFQEAEHGLKSLADEVVEQSDAIRQAHEEAVMAETELREASTHLDAAKAAASATADALGNARAEAERSGVDSAELEQLSRTLDLANHELGACEADLNEARGRLHLISSDVDSTRLEQQREAVERARENADEQVLEYEGAKLLRERLREVESKRTSHLGNALAAPVTSAFLELTRGRYPGVTFDQDLSTEGVVAAGIARDVTNLSVGTQEQLATLIRLAVAAHLKTAVVLDDQLVHSDSERLAWFRDRLRASVKDHDHQVIVFTCRAQDYLSDWHLGGPVDESVTVIDLKRAFGG